MRATKRPHRWLVSATGLEGIRHLAKGKGKGLTPHERALAHFVRRLLPHKANASVAADDGGDLGDDGLVLRGLGGRWAIEYVERGITRVIGEFSDEHRACDEFYRLMCQDGV